LTSQDMRRQIQTPITYFCTSQNIIFRWNLSYINHIKQKYKIKPLKLKLLRLHSKTTRTIMINIDDSFDVASKMRKFKQDEAMKPYKKMNKSS